jgi:hypothetical protein
VLAGSERRVGHELNFPNLQSKGLAPNWNNFS